MTQLITYFSNLCFFRAGPQDAPSSDTVLYVVGILLALCYAWSSTAYDSPFISIVVTAIQVVIYTGVVWLLLKIRNLTERWSQTTVALLGAALLLEVIKIPIIILVPGDDGLITGLQIKGPLMLHVILGIWYFAVMVHVFRQALDTVPFRALAAAFFCQLFTVFLMQIVLSLLGLSVTETV